MGIDPTKARLFVNTIVNEYDRLHNPSSEPVDIFGQSAYYENTREQQIFLEKFSLHEYFKGTVESQDTAYQEQISSLSQLFVKTGILEPSLESKQKRLADREKKSDPTKKTEEPTAGKGTVEKKDGEPEVKASEKKEVDATGSQSAPEEKAEEPTAGKGTVEKKDGEPEVKASEKKEVDATGSQSAPEEKAEESAAGKGAVEKKDHEPDVRTSLERYRQEREKIVEVLVQEEKARHKESGTQAIVQTFLRRENCELDPKDEIINRIIEKVTRIGQRIADRLPQYFNRPKYVKLYPDGNRLFFAHVFQEVYAGSDVEGKERIIGLLKDYRSLLDKSEYVSERALLSYEGKFSKLTKNPYYKIGISIAIGGALYLLIGHVIVPFAIQFFKSSMFAALSSVVLSKLPVVVVENSSQVLGGIAGMVSYVASTRPYQFLFINNPQITGLLMVKFPSFAPLLGSIMLVRNPAIIGAAIGALFFSRSHGLDVRVQDKISASLEKLEDREKAARLLEEGLKAYQVWMYLALQGPNQNDFVYDLPPKSVSSSDETKFLSNKPSAAMEFAYQY